MSAAGVRPSALGKVPGEEPGLDGVVVLRWSRDPRCVANARAELSKALGSWGLTAVEDAALVVLSELLTNAGRHAHVPQGREIETRFQRMGGGVRIEVHDASYERPKLKTPDAESCEGRGILLVSLLADKWGVSERGGPGKLVWAQLSAPAQGDVPHGG